jgi:bifunctional UDP-N-acetylglucosamine pyrophosphorylase/glucosamine-1-phosphate N-acetyltransferase
MGASSVLIIPAAGLGTRLDVRTPKLLVKVGGRAMVDRLLDLYDGAVDRFILVLHPSFEAKVRVHCQNRGRRLGYVRQERPTGMLDAILASIDAARLDDPERIWITWCDQVAIHPATIQQLKELSAQPAAAPLILPTATRQAPYIHMVRDTEGRIVDIRHRREGDQMPQVGESDAGLFSLSSDTYFNRLVEFARQAEAATRTRERNFLPFIAWLSHQGASVQTFPCRDDEEAIGINTSGDLRTIERYLSMRDGIADPLT